MDANPVSQQVRLAGAHDAAIVAAGSVEGVLTRVLVSDLMLKVQLDCGGVITDTATQALGLHH